MIHSSPPGIRWGELLALLRTAGLLCPSWTCHCRAAYPWFLKPWDWWVSVLIILNRMLLGDIFRVTGLQRRAVTKGPRRQCNWIFPIDPLKGRDDLFVRDVRNRAWHVARGGSEGFFFVARALAWPCLFRGVSVTWEVTVVTPLCCADSLSVCFPRPWLWDSLFCHLPGAICRGWSSQRKHPGTDRVGYVHLTVSSDWGSLTPGLRTFHTWVDSFWYRPARWLWVQCIPSFITQRTRDETLSPVWDVYYVPPLGRCLSSLAVPHTAPPADVRFWPPPCRSGKPPRRSRHYHVVWGRVTARS